MLFQFPVLVGDYLQLVNGYYLSTKSQVDGYKKNAMIHEYFNVYEMIEDFKRNSNPAVRMDGEQKEQALDEFEKLEAALDILRNGNVFQKAAYMFTPSRWGILKEVSKDFEPSIPLRPTSFIYSIIAALLLGMLIMWPLRKLAGNRYNA